MAAAGLQVLPQWLATIHAGGASCAGAPSAASGAATCHNSWSVVNPDLFQTALLCVCLNRQKRNARCCPEKVDACPDKHVF